MAATDRLSGLDTAFLHLEDDAAHMHVGSCLVFEGPPPAYEEFVAELTRRLHLVPRYRQRLAFVPWGQGRPRWVDDPHFQPEFHVRHTALPRPGTEAELEALCGRVFAQELDRDKPLWEIWLVEGLDRNRFALLAKTHHCLVDGISGVDITTVLFDTSPDPVPVPAEPNPWLPRPLPTRAQLLGEAMLERATLPREVLRGVRALSRGPRQIAARARDSLVAVGALAWAGVAGAPPSPLNQPIGPHRRFTWVDAELSRFKAIKDALDGTVNDVVLTVVTLALGEFLRERGHDTSGLVLKAMVPVSVRAEAERGVLGNRVSTIYAPLPVDHRDPVDCFGEIHAAMAGLKESGQAVGAEVITELSGFAPPTIMAQAARLQARQRFFNLTVTNVPGPQFDLFLLGRRLLAMKPMVPLARNTALGIAIMSYAGRIDFGLLSDLDSLPDLNRFAGHLAQAVERVAESAGVHGGPPADRPRRAPLGGRRLAEHRRRRPATRAAKSTGR